MSKQTAVEIVLEQLQQLLNQLISGEIESKEYKYYASLSINQANKMFKQQIKNAWLSAWKDSMINPLEDKYYEPDAEQYYNETYNK